VARLRLCLDSRLLLKHHAVLFGRTFGDKCHRG
jgi:hypothetical protein